jgi:Fic family protein
MKYIYQRSDWPAFRWNADLISTLLADVRHRQGRLIGRMEALGISLRNESVVQSLTEEVVRSSQIEGEELDRAQVRSSVARQLGLRIQGMVASGRSVDGVVAMLVDATQNYDKPLNKRRLLSWHSKLFPTGESGFHKIRRGRWRNDSSGAMQVVSGQIGREKVHFEAPIASQVEREMKEFLRWCETENTLDQVLRAGLAHLWFVTIHPFDDGNGRIARAIADMMLARAERSPHRFYSMSAQIHQERKEYYKILEHAQKGSLDVTKWLEWFLSCLGRAFVGTEATLSAVSTKARFFTWLANNPLNERQVKIITRLIDGLEGVLSSSKWAKLARCSQDTASRDINDLVQRGLLVKSKVGGRSTNYTLSNRFSET